jgi:hypothetical protein
MGWHDGLGRNDVWWAVVAACLLFGARWPVALLGAVAAVIPAVVTSWRRWS